jgi:23S rRNA pseudouridine1911/1915/1917 synthase
MATRTLTVPAKDAGQSLVAWLRARLSLPEGEVRRLVRERKVRVGGNLCGSADWRVRAGQRVEVELPARKEPARGPVPVIRHVDEHLVLVDKPSGLTTMRHATDVREFGARAKRYLPTTLQDQLPGLIAAHTGGPPGRVRAVHRLDKETSGLVVFARTPAAESRLGEQFRAHTIERVYRAIVRGEAVSARIESTLVEDRGDGRRGSGPGGQRAVTHVTLIERLGTFSLVECRLETGRTHQVRIHLGEAGTPLCGERIYDRPLHGKPLPDGSGIERVALHAATLGLEHPATGQRMSWSSPLPPDLARALERMRATPPDVPPS